MSMRRHLLLIVGLAIMAAPVGIGQVNTAATILFMGYTDDAPLTGRDDSLYGNQLSLSKARAQRVALAMQKILGLPASALESHGRGASQPIASNATVQGQAMNRRMEV